MEKELRDFLSQYIGSGTDSSDIVKEDAVDILVHFAVHDGIEQEIINYGKENPNAPFWDLLKLVQPGNRGFTDEELFANN